MRGVSYSTAYAGLQHETWPLDTPAVAAPLARSSRRCSFLAAQSSHFTTGLDAGLQRRAWQELRGFRGVPVAVSFFEKDEAVAMAKIAGDVHDAEMNRDIDVHDSETNRDIDGWVLKEYWKDTAEDAKSAVGIYHKENKCAVAFAGNKDMPGWKDNQETVNTECGLKDVHKGFFDEFLRLVTNDAWKDKLAPYLRDHCTDGIYSVGHSIGGALADIFAVCMTHATDGKVRLPKGDAEQDVPMPGGDTKLYTFGEPGISKQLLVNGKKDTGGVFQGARFWNEGSSESDPSPSAPDVLHYRHPKLRGIRMSKSFWSEVHEKQYEAASEESKEESQNQEADEQPADNVMKEYIQRISKLPGSKPGNDTGSNEE